jgi:hypothetical protein
VLTLTPEPPARIQVRTGFSGVAEVSLLGVCVKSLLDEEPGGPEAVRLKECLGATPGAVALKVAV